MKQYLLALSLIALAAVAVFWQQVWSIFAGMTVLESLDMIVTYLLHIAVGTILAVTLFGLPAIIKPWMRMFRQKHKTSRRSLRRNEQPTERVPKMSVYRLALSLLQKQLGAPEKTRSTIQEEPPHIELKF